MSFSPFNDTKTSSALDLGGIKFSGMGRIVIITEGRFLKQGSLKWYHDLMLYSRFLLVKCLMFLLEQDWVSSAFMLS